MVQTISKVQSIDELDLMELPIEDRAFGADPEPWFEQARAKHPWLAKFTHGYLVHGHREVRELIQMDDRLHIATDDVVEIMGATGKPWGDFMKALLIARHGEDHRRMRDALKPFFKPRRIAAHVGLIREVVCALLDEWAPKGEFDFTEFASNFPVAVMFGLIGADIADLPKIKWALEVQGLSYSLDASLLPQMEEAHAMMMAFNSELVAKRRASGEQRDDLLQELIKAEDRGQLSHQEVCEQLFFLFAAGYDTSKNQLGMTARLLFQQPELWERCARDREFCTLAIEEGLRHSSPSSPPRIALEDIEYGGVLIPKGTHLMFCSTSRAAIRAPSTTRWNTGPAAPRPSTTSLSARARISASACTSPASRWRKGCTSSPSASRIRRSSARSPGGASPASGVSKRCRSASRRCKPSEAGIGPIRFGCCPAQGQEKAT
jgi:cytochrome P450